MPYINGQRVTNEEYTAAFGSGAQLLHTGPHGENPAPEGEPTDIVGKPKGKKERSKPSQKKAKAAIADALGVDADDPQLEDIDVSGLDEPVTDQSVQERNAEGSEVGGSQDANEQLIRTDEDADAGEPDEDAPRPVTGDELADLSEDADEPAGEQPVGDDEPPAPPKPASKPKGKKAGK